LTHERIQVTYRGQAQLKQFGSEAGDEFALIVVCDETGAIDVVPQYLSSAVDHCESLVVHARNGTFSLQRATLESVPLVEYVSHHQALATTWVLPLVNFLPDPRAEPPRITFPFQDRPARIEPVRDAAKRAQRLLSGEAKYLITAVMTGAVAAHATNLEALPGWFPFPFLDLLGLASGTPVGAPWIDFRDAEHRLVHRIHRKYNLDPYIPSGRRPMWEERGLARLLGCAAASPQFRENYLSIATRRLVRSMDPYQTLDDRVSHLTRTLESLTAHYPPPATRPPYLYDALGAAQQQIVDAGVDQAATTIRTAAASIKAAGDEAQSEILDRLARDIEQAGHNNSPAFSDKLVSLLDYFGFADAEVAGAGLTANQRTGRQGWLRIVNDARNITAHRASFSFGPQGASVITTYQLERHLHDILVRVVLHEYGYDGHYQPSVSVWRDLQTVGWVRPDTHPSRLGYT
jgi:hypothetical protein